MKWTLVALSLGLLGRCGKADPVDTGPVPRAPSAPVASAAPNGAPPLFDLVGALPTCDVEHDGLFLDVGTTAVDARRDHSVGPFTDVVTNERAGASFARVYTRRLAYEFTLVEPTENSVISLRAMGVVSRQLTAYLDDRRVGFATLPREDAGVVSFADAGALGAGLHTLTLRFGGGPQGADDPYAEVDWIRIGPKLPSGESYAPPTLRDIVTDVVLDGVPRRSIVLRSPSTVRCSLRVERGMKLTAGLGYWGNGRGVATVRVVADGKEPVTLAERKVTGGTGATWTGLSASLDAYAGRIVGLELSSPDSGGGGRVAFGEPAIVATDAVAKSSPDAKIVVVVMEAGLDRRMVPPWGPSAELPSVARLARDGVAFDGYRVPTTVAGSVVASLLTGMSPRAHGLEDTTSRLREDVRLIGERVKEESIHAGFFTGVPTSFAAFGFDRGWDRFETFSPIKDLPATEPLSTGAAWLKEQIEADHDGKLLLVVHARGGHPPWDVTRDEVALLPPEEYAGALEPRAGALVLANLRGQRQRGPVDQRLSGDDWRRLRALEETALKKQDAGLHRVIDTLEKAGLYDRALVVFMGDVAVGEPPAVPFAPVPQLREDVLLTPMIVKFPGGALAGSQAGAMVSTTDLTKTLLDALGVDAEGTEGTDLFRLAQGEASLDGHPLVATLGAHYATRWGQWLLAGDLGRRPTLCQLDVDPACATDAFAAGPIAAEALWQRTYRSEVAARAARGNTRIPKAPADLDADTEAALKVFGY